MADRPDDIIITDLLDPVRSPEQLAALEAAAAAAPPLTEDAVLTTAKEQTGLSDFGPDDFRERLRLWLELGAESPILSSVTRAGLFMDCVRFASNRLRVEDAVKRHPEILDIEIKQPIIIAGLPRSGTTHLQNLIAADKRLRSMPYWEAIRPVPGPGEGPEAKGEDPRYTRCKAEWDQLDLLLPHLKAMHEFSPDHISEDIELQGIDFSGYAIDWNYRPTQWRDYYFAHDQTSTYAYMKKVLKVMQWVHGPDRWVLKCPQHMEQLIPLKTVFPDATYVITHRDPVAVLQSALTAMTYSARLLRKEPTPKGDADYWIDRIGRLLKACVRDRDAMPEARTLDVFFHQFMKDDVATVEKVYAKAGLPMTDAARFQFQEFMRLNPRSKYGKLHYDFKKNFGMDPADVRKHYDFYFERYPQVVAEA